MSHNNGHTRMSSVPINRKERNEGETSERTLSVDGAALGEGARTTLNQGANLESLPYHPLDQVTLPVTGTMVPSSFQEIGLGLTLDIQESEAEQEHPPGTGDDGLVAQNLYQFKTAPYIHDNLQDTIHSNNGRIGTSSVLDSPPSPGDITILNQPVSALTQVHPLSRSTLLYSSNTSLSAVHPYGFHLNQESQARANSRTDGPLDQGSGPSEAWLQNHEQNSLGTSGSFEKRGSTKWTIPVESPSSSSKSSFLSVRPVSAETSSSRQSRSGMTTPQHYHIAIEIDTPMGTKKRASDMESTISLSRFPRQDTQHEHGNHRKQGSLEESDIERYSKLISKARARMSVYGSGNTFPFLEDENTPANYPREEDQPPRLSVNVPGRDISSSFMNPPSSLPPASRSQGQDGENPAAASPPSRWSKIASPALTALSFSSVKGNLLRQLFGSPSLSAGLGSSSGPGQGSESAITRDGTATNGRKEEKGKEPKRESSEGSLQSQQGLQAQYPNVHDTGTGLQNLGAVVEPGVVRGDHISPLEQRDKVTVKRSHTRSGGILSNLLRLQALSQPPHPSKNRHARTSHHHHRHHSHHGSRPRHSSQRQKKQGPIERRSSVASDIPPRRKAVGTFPSRSASILSLPGLVMVAPTGVGFSPSTISNSVSMQSPTTIDTPEQSTYLNTPASESGVKLISPGDHNGGQRRGHGRQGTSTSQITGYEEDDEGDDMERRLSPDSITFVDTTGAHKASPRSARSSTSSACLQPYVKRLRHQQQYLQTHNPHLYSTRSSYSADDSASVYSCLSQDAIAAALRLSRQAELTEAVADMMLQQDLLIRLCKSFICYGAPSHRIEFAMEAMCRTLGIDGSFAFLPGLMMISFGDSDTHTSETHLIKCTADFDLGRLSRVNGIARAIVCGQIELAEALDQLKEINAEPPPYPGWLLLGTYIASSGLMAPLVFNGSWYDMLAGMGLGTVVGLTNLLADRYSVYSNVFEVSTSIMIAFVAKALREYVCFTGVVLSGIVMLLPGLSLTTSIMELSSRNMISGSVRMFYSLIYCLFLGFGLSTGSNLWDVFKDPLPGELNMGYCHPATERWRWALFPLLAMTYNIRLKAMPRQWPFMIVCSSVGYAISELSRQYWPHSLHISAAVSAFVVGLLGNIYERVTHELSFIQILGAIILIVPGGMGVRSSLLLLDNSGNVAQGTAFALQMIIVALGIAVGLFAATLVVYPLGKKRNALLTF